MRKFYMIILIMTIVIIVKVKGQEFPFGAGFVLEGNPLLNQEFTLCFVAKIVNGDAPLCRFSIEIPVGINPLSDTSSFIIELKQGDSVCYPFRMKVIKEGAYQIKGVLNILEPAMQLLSEYYIISGQDSSLYSNQCFEGYIYNLGTDTVPIAPKSFTPTENTWTIQGTLRYYDSDEESYVPLRGIKVTFHQPFPFPSYETTTDNNGFYQITPVPGPVGYLSIEAVNSAAEIHPFWEVYIDWWWIVPRIKLNISPPTYCFQTTIIHLLSPGIYEYSYDFEEGEKADWARILRTVSEVKSKVLNSTGGFTVDYLEVSYPTQSILGHEFSNPFYVPAGIVLAASINLGVAWYGFELEYRNPNQIVIPNENSVWYVGGKKDIAHEWGHALMTKCFNNRNPHGDSYLDHWWDVVTNQGLALSEGFSYFFEDAIWIDELGIQFYTNQKEKFYANQRPGSSPPIYEPWYKGEFFNNTDGRKVEGSVMQFLWDLFDSYNTLDNTPGMDDERVLLEGDLSRIISTLCDVGSAMQERRSDWINITEDEPLIRFAVKEGYFAEPDSFNFSGKFKDKWHLRQYGDINELYNIDIHPFNYLQPYSVPVPSELSAFDVTSNSVKLRWRNNSVNAGQFHICRQQQGQTNWDTFAIRRSLLQYQEFWDSNLDCFKKYTYKVRALTCDTSRFSSPITVKLRTCVTCDMATGPNNGTHLMRVPNSKELYMVFQNQNKIYCSYSGDDGENWETEEIGEGLYPTIGLNYKGLPWIAYTHNGDLICKIKRPDGTYQETILFQENGFWAGQPSIALATMPIKEGVLDYAYLVYPVYDGDAPQDPIPGPPDEFTSSYIYITLFDTLKAHTHLLDVKIDPSIPLSHPCVAITPADLIHITWQQGDEIWYTTNTDSVTPDNWENVQWTEKYNLSNTPDFASEHPFVTSYGDIVSVAWKENNENGIGEIIRKQRYVWEPSEYENWSEPVNLSNSTDMNSDYPQMASGNVVLWQEQSPDGSYKVNANICDNILCLTPDANNVSYVHANALVIDPKAPEIKVYYAYTDEISDNELYEVKFNTYLFPEGIPGDQNEVQYYDGKTGEGVVSPYCESRTGYIDYGDYKIDYGTTLDYLLKYLDPCKIYLFQAIVYQDTTGTIRQRLEVEDTLAATMRVNPEIPETVNIFISPNSYQEDLASALEIIKTRGAFAAIADFKIYEYEVINDSGTGGGGQQSAGTQNLPIPTILQAPMPNPFNNYTTIRFQIPTKTKVDLKVYNSTGRLVNTLVNSEMNPGYYTMSWNGKDDISRTQGNGIYFIRLKTKDYDMTKKMVLVK